MPMNWIRDQLPSPARFMSVKLTSSATAIGRTPKVSSSSIAGATNA
jgi:hypothetical protein